MEPNQAVTYLLLKGLTVEGLSGWDGGRGQTIRYIAWDDVAANSFTVASQFRIDCPPGHDVGKGFIITDLVLLVNLVPVHRNGTKFWVYAACCVFMGSSGLMVGGGRWPWRSISQWSM